MIGNIARGAFLFMLALMIVSWALGVGNSRQVEQQPEPLYYRIYS